MKKRTVLSAICCIILAAAALITLPVSYTSADHISTDDVPDSCLICCTGDMIEQQKSGEDAAYAAAYVMRYLGEDISGGELASQNKRVCGFTAPCSVAKAFRKHGFDAKAYHGDVDTLKQRLAEGTPVIVFIRMQGGTRYAVVTGYDSEHIYLVDSSDTNTDSPYYNRVVSIPEFEKLWKTNTLIANNAYIVADKKR